MVAFELKTKQDIQDFATGCCFFGCGGGGDPEAGIVALTEVLEKGKPLQVTSFDDLKDDDTYASVFLMGSIAPKTDEIIAKQKRNGVPVDPPYSPQEMLSKSLDVLEATLVMPSNPMDALPWYIAQIVFWISSTPCASII